jgi:hypothetical protein
MHDDCAGGFSWDEILLQAQQAHVTINPIDTMGCGWRARAVRATDISVWPTRPAVTPWPNSNDFVPGIKQIFLENSSYYLMAYAPTHDAEDGTFRRVSVSIKGRPDLEVRTRRSYWAEKRKPGDAAAEPPPTLAALAGILPESKLPLRATAAPFAATGGNGAQVTISLGIKQPAFAARTPEQSKVLIKAFTGRRRPAGSDSQMIPITVPAAKLDRDTSRYEVLARLDLPKPGKYQLRLSAHSAASDTTRRRLP